MSQPELRWVEIKKIQPNKINPRLEFRKQVLDELADSIRQVGLLEPIVVQPIGQDRFTVVVGERRYRAALQAGLDRIPVLVRKCSEREVLELNFIENVHREDLTPVEKGRLCHRLLERFPEQYASVYALGKVLGMSETHIYEWLKLLEVPEEVQRLIKTRSDLVQRTREPWIDYRTAAAIATHVKQPQRQIQVARAVAKRGLPPGAALEVIKKAAQQPEKSVQEVYKEVVDDAPIYLPFSHAHGDAITRRVKTQTARKSRDPRLQPGRVVRAQITHFADLEITALSRKRLGDFDEQDGRREGGYTLEEFKKVWQSLHGDWNPDETVNVIQFQLKHVIGDEGESTDRS